MGIAHFVGGDSRPRVMKASRSYPFAKCDLLYEHPADHTLRRASDMNAQGTAEKGQLGLAQYFVGVAGVKNGLESGEVTAKANQNFEEEVVVFTGGIWAFDCPSQQFVAGQGVGVYADANGLCPDSQKVDSLKGSATLSARIGVAVPTSGAIRVGASGLTRVQVEIQPKSVWEGGIPSAGTYTGTSGH